MVWVRYSSGFTIYFHLSFDQCNSIDECESLEQIDFLVHLHSGLLQFFQSRNCIIREGDCCLCSFIILVRDAEIERSGFVEGVAWFDFCSVEFERGLA